jgi:MFS family permease
MPAFYLSSLLAFTGGHMVNYAVILYLQEKVGSDLLSGIGFGLSFGTSILFGWFAGVLCDRISPTRVIHAAQALFILCLAGLWWTDAGASDATRVGWTLFSAFLGGLAWSFVGPARLATLGQIAPPDKLKPATIVFNLQVLLGFGLAPVVIGLVRSRHGWPAVFATGMGFFVAASLMLFGTRTRGSNRPGQGVFTELGEGFSAVKANPLLLQLILAAIMAYAMTGPMQILLPKLAREVLGLSELQRGGYLGLMALTLILGGVSALMLGKFLHHGAAIFRRHDDSKPPVCVPEPMDQRCCLGHGAGRDGPARRHGDQLHHRRHPGPGARSPARAHHEHLFDHLAGGSCRLRRGGRRLGARHRRHPGDSLRRGGAGGPGAAGCRPDAAAAARRQMMIFI